jgi:hypothetical protein
MGTTGAFSNEPGFFDAGFFGGLLVGAGAAVVTLTVCTSVWVDVADAAVVATRDKLEIKDSNFILINLKRRPKNGVLKMPSRNKTALTNPQEVSPDQLRSVVQLAIVNEHHN